MASSARSSGPRASYLRGERIGRYEVIGRLGKGGMAAVYAVRHRGVGDFEKTLALKVILPHLVEEQSYLTMFLDEIRIISRIEHPNVVQILDAGEHRGAPFMVMPLLRGRTLAACRDRGAAPALLAGWLAEVGQGLHGAHETRDHDGTWLEIVHRDVSASNVFVAADGLARILDFGIAAAVGRTTSTRHGELKGRFSMMAPEVVTRHVAIDRRADVWSLGVLVWESVTGARLFRGDNEAETLWRVLNATVPPLPDHVPSAVREAVEDALVREVADRAPTTLPLAAALEAWAEADGGGVDARAAWMSATFDDLDGPAALEPEPPDEAGSVAQLADRSEVTGGTARRRILLGMAAMGALAGVGAGGWLATQVAPEAPPNAHSPPPPPSEATAVVPEPTPAAATVEAAVEPARVEAAVIDAETVGDESAEDEPTTAPDASPPASPPAGARRRRRRSTASRRAGRAPSRLLDSPYSTQ